MTLRTPPSWLQYGSHSAENDRLTQQALWSTTGVIGDTMAVSAYALLQVQVASGWCSIVSSYSNGGVYVGYNDAPVVLTVSTPDVTNPRIDLVVATVNDQAYTGVTNNIVYQIITGNPAGSPVVPSTPTNSVALAQIAVAANATSISAANITDLRVPTYSDADISPIQSVRLTANGSAIGAAGVPFGATNRIAVTAGHNYLVDIFLPFTKTTAGTVTWRLNTSTGSTHTFAATFVDTLNQSPTTYVASAANANWAASASYATATTYLPRFYGTFTAGATGFLFLDISTISAGTVTPLKGASMTVTDLGWTATVGSVG
jgi:hypothetical protein